ncbi:TIGR01777 family oxidoreductase [Ornithinibacillus californiensis]|uniref:TIGR01777 family oxidoreductase n=1 Tax=Ornithinibacillus californiensis TaxID=161536 RepID=UPI00064DD29F|nr:TIGR01777 family oxidoreductase [Ornithinibacillus californiensis]
MMKKVVLAGGTGFIGTYFEKRFKELGFNVLIISRQDKHIHWNDRRGIVDALEGAELLVNLAGKSINCRYNEKNKQAIMESRITTTNILGECIQRCENQPKVWMNSSTVTIYRDSVDAPMTEEHGEIGTGFSVDVASRWEQEMFRFDLPNTRQIALRIAIVLGKDGGAIMPLRNLVRFGLGGKQGNGEQKVSWIHIEDLFQSVLFLSQRTDLDGVINCSAPNPVSNKEFMATLRKVMGRKMGLPAPKMILELGAFVIRTESELVLKSRWVLPEKLEQSGFKFEYETLENTLQDIM